MKYLLIFLTTLMLSSCASQGGTSSTNAYAAGAGLKIDLPSGFKFQKFPSPVPGGSNIKITKGTLQLAITGFAVEGRMQTEEELKQSLQKAVDSQYRSLANETHANPIVFSKDGMLGAYESLSSKSGKADFLPFQGFRCSYVTVAAVNTKAGVLIITLAAHSNDSDYAAALTAIKGLRLE